MSILIIAFLFCIAVSVYLFSVFMHINWVFVGGIVAVLLYAILSIFLKKPLGLYIATAFHILLGILSLPSIGLYVLGLAVIELIVGIIMTVKFWCKRRLSSTRLHT